MKAQALRSLLWLSCGLLVAPAAAAQDKNSLSQARRYHGVADANDDGQLSAAELATLRVPADSVKRFDLDGNGTWSRDEFVVYYRELLVAQGQRPAADLEEETARIQAAEKARQEAEKKRQEGVKVNRVGRAQRANTERARAGDGDPQQAERASRQIDDRARAGQIGSVEDLKGLTVQLRADLAETQADLSRKVAAGQLSREDAEGQYRVAVQRARQAGTRRGAGDGQGEGREQPDVRGEVGSAEDLSGLTVDLRANLARMQADLSNKVAAGALPREEAERQYRAALQRAQQNGTRRGVGQAGTREAGTRGGTPDQIGSPQDLNGFTGELRANLARLQADLSRQVAAGEMTRVDAERQYRAALQRAQQGGTRRGTNGDAGTQGEAGTRGGTADRIGSPQDLNGFTGELRANLARLQADLTRKVAAGELTRVDAERQYRAALQRAQQGGTRRGTDGDNNGRGNGGDAGTRGQIGSAEDLNGLPAAQRQQMTRVMTSLRQQVAAGTLTAREAQAQYRTALDRARKAAAEEARGGGETRGGNGRGQTPPARGGETRGSGRGRGDAPPARGGETRGRGGETPPPAGRGGGTRGGGRGGVL